MQITFLGTGTSQGVPVIACDCGICGSANPADKRLRSSVMIETDGKVLIIDSGPDFRQQLLRERVMTIDAILVTHEHMDHIGGLDEVRSFNYLQKKAIPVFARKEVLQVIKKSYEYAFREEPYPGVPELELHEIGNCPFDCSGIKIIPVQLMHSRLPVFGYRIGDFAYLTDMSAINEEELSKLNGLKVAVLGALRKKIHHSHMNLSQALELVERLKPEKAFLTHISHLMGLHDEIEKELPENVSLAFDGLKIEF